MKIFPEGSADVTNDLALEFKISLDDAERLKLGKMPTGMYPRKKTEDDSARRLNRICGHIEKHLKSIDKKNLPAVIGELKNKEAF